MNSKTKIKNFSTLGFIMSSIGAAVGLGNIWRFPKEMVASGGSSFILIYIIILVLIAFPVVLLEMQYGLFFKKSVVSCFKNVNKKVGGFLGWKQVWVNLFACVYYVVVIAWFMVGFVHSIVPQLFKQWGESTTNGISYFDDKILQLPSGSSGIGFSYWTLIGIVVLLLLIFVVISLGIKRGLEKTNLFLVPSLFFLLIGLTIYSLTRDNAILGLKKLFEFKGSSFAKPFVWYKATIQAMFSTGIMLGTFIVLTKNANIKMDKGNDALIIIASDSFVGILSGILITTIVASGFSGNSEEVTKQINEFFQDSGSEGSSLVFKTLPKVFYGMEDKVLGQILFVTFIVGFLFATFSSIIVLIEIFVDAMIEKFPNIGRKKILGFWSIFALIQCIVFIVFHQSKMTDEQDLWINHFVLVVGFFELLILVLYKNFDKIIKKNEQHTYLKMSPGKWLKRLLLFVTIPIVFILVIFGFIELFNVDVIYFENSPEWIQNIFNIQNKNKDSLLKAWTSPERLFTIATIIFMILIPLLLSMITNKSKKVLEKK